MFVRAKRSTYQPRRPDHPNAHILDRRLSPPGREVPVTYQLVQNVREGGRVRQRVILHLGSHRTVEAAIADWTVAVEAYREQLPRAEARVEAAAAAIRQAEAAYERYAGRSLRRADGSVFTPGRRPPYVLADGEVAPLERGAPRGRREMLRPYWDAVRNRDGFQRRIAENTAKIARLTAEASPPPTAIASALAHRRRMREEAGAWMAARVAAFQASAGRSAQQSPAVSDHEAPRRCPTCGAVNGAVGAPNEAPQSANGSAHNANSAAPSEALQTAPATSGGGR